MSWTLCVLATYLNFYGVRLSNVSISSPLSITVGLPVVLRTSYDSVLFGRGHPGHTQLDTMDSMDTDILDIMDTKHFVQYEHRHFGQSRHFVYYAHYGPGYFGRY